MNDEDGWIRWFDYAVWAGLILAVVVLLVVAISG